MTEAKQIMSVFVDAARTHYEGDFENIKEVKLFLGNLVFLLFTHTNYHRLFPNEPYHINTMINLGIAPKYLGEFELLNKKIATQIDILSENLLKEKVNLSSLREDFLAVEILFSKTDIQIETGKTTRDSIGSYYTPKSLAKSMVKEIFSSDTALIKRLNKKENLLIADLSCGGGEFFCTIQSYLHEEFKISYSQSAEFFWGIDLDPVALQICISNLLSHAPQKSWKAIISHFRLGNPLLNTEKESDYSVKCQMFLCGRIYSQEMGIDQSSFYPDSLFDVVIGNPPWEKIRFEERKFFVSTYPEIAAMSKKNDRTKAMAALKEKWHTLYELASEISSDYFSFSKFVIHHPLLKYSLSGELNTYAMFTELGINLCNEGGLCSLIVKSTLATTPAHQKLWNHLILQEKVSALYVFDNRNKIFPIDSRERFAIVILRNQRQHQFKFCAGLTDVEAFETSKRILLNKDDVNTINPETGMIPNVSNTDDVSTLIYVHRNYPLFCKEFPDCHFGRLVHFTAHAEYIDKTASADNLPIYEGKFIEQYDARFSTFANMSMEQKYATKASATKIPDTGKLKELPESRFFIKKEFWEKFKNQYPEDFSLCWRSLTSPTNRRTTIAMILPTMPTSQSIQMLQVSNDAELLLLLGLLNSKPFDYLVRLKMPGIDLTQTVINQIPVPPQTAYDKVISLQGKNERIQTHILSLVCHLLRTEDLIIPLLNRMEGSTYRLIDTVSDEKVRHDLDLLFMDAYGFDGNMRSKIYANFKE